MEHWKKKNSFSYKDLLYKALIFVGTVAFIVYFLPRDGKFNYQFDINKPWKYGQLMATFDFPIYKDEEVKKMIDESNENMLSKFLAMFNRRTKFVAIMLTDSKGMQIEFPDVPENSMPEVGDAGKNQDGTLPDGEILMADGTTLIFEKGIVKEME